MKHRSVSLDSIGYDVAQSAGDEPDARRLYRLRLIRRIAEGELTLRQQQCFELYFQEGMCERDIAQAIGVSVPTVSRHLSRAIRRIRRILRYCGG